MEIYEVSDEELRTIVLKKFNELKEKTQAGNCIKLENW